MVIGTFHIPKAKAKVVKARDGADVAARYFVYKLYEATGGYPMQSAALYGIGESATTIPGRLSAEWSFSRGASRWNGRLR